jgi:hypothetical protein
LQIVKIKIKMSKCQNINPSSADAAHIAAVVVAHIKAVAAAAAEEDAPREVVVANLEGSTPETNVHTKSKTYKI